MARIRTIKPMFFQDETLSTLDVQTHILAAGLLCYADDEGYFNANPRLIHAAIFPLRELSRPIHELLTELSVSQYIELGDGSDGKTYGRIVNFSKHQRVNRKTPSTISNLQISWRTHGGLTEDSSQIPSGIRNKEGNKEVEGKEISLTAFEYSHAICQQAGIPATDPNQKVVRASIEEIQYREKCDLESAASKLRDAVELAAGRSEKIDRFWFENGRYKPKPEPPPSPKRQSVADKMRKQTEEDLAASRARAAAAGMVN